MAVLPNRSKTNYLSDLHSAMIQLPKLFRENVCEECAWSEATFYRKAKGKNSFSNAEKDKMKCIAESLVNKLLKPSPNGSVNK